jgi:hypothetical protein
VTLFFLDQLQEIQRAGDEPVRLADPETQTECVILWADVYEHIRASADHTRAGYLLAMKVFALIPVHRSGE